LVRAIRGALFFSLFTGRFFASGDFAFAVLQAAIGN